MKPILSHRYIRVIQMIGEDEVNISKVFDPYDYQAVEPQICAIFGLHNVMEIGFFKRYDYYLTTDPMKPEDCEILDEPGLSTLISLALDDEIKKPFILFHSDGKIYVPEIMVQTQEKETTNNEQDETPATIIVSENDGQSSFEISE